MRGWAKNVALSVLFVTIYPASRASLGWALVGAGGLGRIGLQGVVIAILAFEHVPIDRLQDLIEEAVHRPTH
jgi:hypothetical protein